MYCNLFQFARVTILPHAKSTPSAFPLTHEGTEKRGWSERERGRVGEFGVPSKYYSWWRNKHFERWGQASEGESSAGCMNRSCGPDNTPRISSNDLNTILWLMPRHLFLFAHNSIHNYLHGRAYSFIINPDKGWKDDKCSSLNEDTVAGTVECVIISLEGRESRWVTLRTNEFPGGSTRTSVTAWG